VKKNKAKSNKKEVGSKRQASSTPSKALLNAPKKKNGSQMHQVLAQMSKRPKENKNSQKKRQVKAE